MKTERLWKTIQLEVHQLHLKELLISLNGVVRDAKTAYSANLIHLTTKVHKFSFKTVNTIVSPMACQVSS